MTIKKSDYFELLTETEWQEYLEKEKLRLFDLFGDTVVFKLKVGELLKRNYAEI